MINTTLCYIEKSHKYLMLHRNKKAGDLNAQKWIGVGGKFEIGESAEECLIREVYEETGLSLTSFVYVGMIKFQSDKYEDEDMYLFKGTGFEGEINSDCNEGTLEWIDEDKVLDLPTWEGDKYFLKPLLAGQTGLNMTVRYEGDKLVEFRDDTKSVVIEKSDIISSKHAFSTRIGGISEGIFDSLNLGLHRGDINERVTENWRRFLEASGIGYRKFVCARQVHKNDVEIVTSLNARLVYDDNAQDIEADGFVTCEKGLPIVIFTADCVPVLLEDAKAGVIGAVHCGWRSTVADIEAVVIEKMCLLGANREDIKIAIGPAIDKCCFEVGEEVIEAVDNLLGKEEGRNYRTNHKEGKYMLDLRGVVKRRFEQLKIDATNIDIVGECTMCHPETYYSHRYTNGERGSQASVICLLNSEI